MTGILEAEDVHSTRRAVEALGATVREDGDELVVTPPEALREPGDVIDCGNSGTSLRLLAGVLSGVPGLSVLTGDASLRRRPVRRVIDPLRRMGANLSARDGDRLPPLVVRGRLAPGHPPGAGGGERPGEERHPARRPAAPRARPPWSSRSARATTPSGCSCGMGVPVRVEGLSVTVSPARPRGIARWTCPGDISSAAFFLCAAAGLPGSAVTVRNLGVNPTRTGLLEVLAAMGAEVERAGEREVAGEPRADVTVRARDLRAARRSPGRSSPGSSTSCRC